MNRTEDPSAMPRPAPARNAAAVFSPLDAGAAPGGVAKEAPSPPKTNGNTPCPIAFETAEMTAAQAMLTAL